MLTYEYQCDACGCRFERRQSISDAPLNECPECNGPVRRLISGGMGFHLKGEASHCPSGGRGQDCSFEQHGRTCCGRNEPCGA